MNKIALGTVQFGLEYGVNNRTGIPDSNEISEIFSTAYNAGIEILDTAYAYGDAEARIGNHADNRFNIISKFPAVASADNLKNYILKSLENTKSENLYGYLAHNADSIIYSPELWDQLIDFKKSSLIKKIGYSLYSTEQLEILLDRDCIPDIVQVPYSLLDRKFDRFFTHLKSLGTEIHVRSVFLQGLYFMDFNKLPEKLSGLAQPLQQLNEICDRYKVTIGSLALNFAVQNKLIDHVVIGVETPVQLMDNINTVNSWNSNSNCLIETSRVKVENESLLNPSNWK